MQEIATYAEIKKRYDGEWVLITNPVMTKKLEIVRGTVACHSKDREVVWQKALELRPKNAAVLFLGHTPKNREYAL